MKILVITTGGTIGSTWSNGYIGLDTQSEFPLLSLYHQKMESCGKRDIEFTLRARQKVLAFLSGMLYYSVL